MNPFTRQWWLQGDFDKHLDTWHLEYHHGRHRIRHNNHVRYVAGEWCRPDPRTGMPIPIGNTIPAQEVGI
jgi:hypothetical protein